MKHCTSKSDIPTTKHYAALVFSTIHIPGDQRSIDAPGHGYPASDEPKIDYIKFDNRPEMEAWVEKKMEHRIGPENFIIVEAELKPITTKVIVDV